MKNLLIIGSLLLLVGCQPHTYIQNAPHVPLLDQGGDLSVTGHIGLNHLEVQVAYSPKHYFGVMANYFFTSPSDNFWEAGVGYYSNPMNKVQFEFYTGYGQGMAVGSKTVEGYNGYWKRFYEFDAKYQRLFFQPVLEFNGDRGHKFYLASRISIIDYSRYRYREWEQDLGPGGNPFLVIVPDWSTPQTRPGIIRDFLMGMQINSDIYRVNIQLGKAVRHSEFVDLEGHPLYAGLYLNIGWTLWFNVKGLSSPRNALFFE